MAFVRQVPMLAKRPGLRVCAANGTEIQNYGQKVIKFQGLDAFNVHVVFSWSA